MKTKAAFFLLGLFQCYVLSSQNTDVHPLSDTYVIQNGGGNEIVSFQDASIAVFKYYKAMEKYPCDTLVKLTSFMTEAGYDWDFKDISLADLDGDGLDEIIASWIKNSKVELIVLKVDPGKLNVDPENAWIKEVNVSKASPAVYQPADWQLYPVIQTKACNIDSEPGLEIVTAYWAQDRMIEITVYDVDKDLNINQIASIRDQLIQEPAAVSLCEDMMFLYDIECCDLNGDGIDEILLSGRRDRTPSGYNIFANVYSMNQNTGILESKIKKDIFSQDVANYDIGNFNMVSGFFHSTSAKSAVIGLLEYENNVYGGLIKKTFVSNILIPVSVNSPLSEMVVEDPIYQRHDSIPNNCYYNRTSTLVAEDFNNDGFDEMLYAFSFSFSLPTLRIYEGASPGGFKIYADLDTIADKFSGVIVVGDIKKDTAENSSLREIVISRRNAGSYYPVTEVYQLRVKQDGSFDKLLLLSKNQNSELHFFMAENILAGNLDNDIRIGKPKRHSVTEVLQPLVILNAPPIHFDVFNNQCYDICKSYNENQSKFIARYIKESMQSTEVTTELNRDWSISASASGGFSVWGVSVSAHLSQTYGKRFSKVDGTSRKVTVGVAIDATVDDQIYATVMDYDIWEYPIYGNDEIKGHILVVEPKIVKNSWFDSKSWKGYDYIPNHEVGNILSYRRYPSLLDNPMMAEKIKGDYGLQTSFLVSANSSYNWFLNFSDFTESQASTTREFSRDWGVSVSGWGCGASLDGSYNSEDIQTQRTTIESNINLDVHFDAVNMGLGETRFEITPYAFWANNGALVIDYAVEPEVSGPGGEDTWWDAHYGYLPDPAFILPWRYDPEKGHAISEIKRYQTKDIFFLPENPLAGDIITIFANVHNFSLLPTAGPVGVRFYVGDPDDGGTQIIGEGMVTEVFTPGIIEPRGTHRISMKWKIPDDLPAYPRIYAEIDAGKNLTEIHENNNKSWNILQKTTGIQWPDNVEENTSYRFQLEQNYPNPFRDITRIRFSIPVEEFVTIEIYNIYGQRLETLANTKMMAGDHEVEFNGQNLTNGIYVCRIKAGNNSKVMKMMLSD